jgi:hypothetical protein
MDSRKMYINEEVTMDFRRLYGGLIIAAFLALPLSLPFTVGANDEEKWEQQAEASFFLGRGMGRQLMTQEEWQQHQEKMRSLSQEARQEYREEWHKKMFERAQERGITMPEMPGPHGKGMGPGSGMGPGKDMSPRGGRY